MTSVVSRRRVLVFDDSPLTLQLVHDALEGAGFEVGTAIDLDSFEARRGELQPDLILVDVEMPEAFGDDVAATLRGARGVRTPILLVSNLEPSELAERARDSSADGWISKRQGLQEIVRRVKELLS
jgi:two-component system sensor histidine kinase and response regulator WspE